MSAPSESDAVADTYHVALTILAARAMQNAMTLWMQEVPIVDQSHTAMLRWYSATSKLVSLYRGYAQELAYAFIRLNRALNVHATVVTPGTSSEPVALDELRTDFVKVVKKYAPEALKADPVAEAVPEGTPSDVAAELTDTSQPTKTEQPKGDSAPSKASKAPQKASNTSPRPDTPQGFGSASGGRYKPYTGKAKDYGTEAPESVPSDTLPKLDSLRAAREKAAQEELELILQEVGAKRLALRQGKVTDKNEASDIHTKVGSAVALHVDRMVMNGGRTTEVDTGQADKKAVAFVRVHEPHGDINPCGFCAMLLSRGAVYKTRASAGGGDQMNQFHNADHCRVEAVYSKEQYNTSARFDVNRKFAKLWKDMNAGRLKSYGFEGLQEFRRHVRDMAVRETASKSSDSGRIK